MSIAPGIPGVGGVGDEGAVAQTVDGRADRSRLRIDRVDVG